MNDLPPGAVVWASLDPRVGREHASRRPVVVVSSDGYADVVTPLLVVVPVSRTDRGWPNHVRVTGISDLPPCFALTELPRTISRARLAEPIGQLDDSCLSEIRRWLADFLDL